MAGINDTDIRLDDDWQLTQASTGDAPACSGVDCFLQDIRLEAITQPGELFYDEEWGWGLLEFIQAEDDEMTRLEIGERIKEKLRRRSEIKADTVTTEFLFSEDILQILVRFARACNSLRYFSICPIAWTYALNAFSFILLLLPFVRSRRDNSNDVPCFVEDNHLAVFLLLDDQPVFRGQSSLADLDFLRSCGLFSVPHLFPPFLFPPFVV